MVFFEDGLFCQVFGIEYAFQLSDPGFLKRGQWGVYYIENRKLTGIIYKSYNGQAMGLDQMVISKFEGDIAENGDIRNWRLIEPYPELRKSTKDLDRINEITIRYFKEPVTYRLYPFPEKSMLDSTKVWINKYRE